VKYSNNPRFCVCWTVRHDAGPAGECVFFFGRVTRKRALGKKILKGREDAEGKVGGKLISGID